MCDVSMNCRKVSDSVLSVSLQLSSPKALTDRRCCWYRKKPDAPGAVTDPHWFPIVQKRNFKSRLTIQDGRFIAPSPLSAAAMERCRTLSLTIRRSTSEKRGIFQL
jgi:hypothetical protein